MKRIVWNALGPDERVAALARPKQRADGALQEQVSEILEAVRDHGWRAVCDLAQRLDGESPREIEVAPLAAEARQRLGALEVEALELAAETISAFHRASLPEDFRMETLPGLQVAKTWRPIERVGLYVPGGNTPLFSSLMMLAIPALAAGVPDIVVVTPPRPGGGLDDLIALAAELSGIERIWTLGGAQAIAALGFGAGEIRKVDKICGPGNAWVAEAKRQMAAMRDGPSIDMPAGPSELMVIADETSDPTLVAADLLSQAEHDADAQVLMVTPDPALASEVVLEIDRRLTVLPRRDIAAKALLNGRIIEVADLEEAIGVANLYAPEHLSLGVEPWEALVPRVRNAGAIFAGPLAAETFGDYCAGSSHVLPTDGAARSWGGVSVYTFLKAISVQSVTRDAARRIARPAALLARMESLEGHARAADARLGALI